MISKFFVSVLTLLCLVPVPLRAERPALIPRKVLFGSPERIRARISPDGKRLAYLAPENGLMNIWVRTVGQGDDHAVTSNDSRGFPFFCWQEDSQHILYGQDIDGNEQWHIYQIDLTSKSIRDLTPFEGIAADIVALSPNFPDSMLVGMNIRLQGKGLNDVYRLNLKDGTVALDTENPGDVATWFVDSEFQVRAAQVASPDGSTEIRVRDNTQSEWRSLLKSGPHESFGGVIGFTPGGKGLNVISSNGANTSRLLKLDLTSGKSKVLVGDEHYDVTDWISNPSTRTLEAVGFTRARRVWKVVDKSFARDFDILRRLHDGDLSIVSQDRANRTWIVVYEVDRGPFYYYIYDRVMHRATLLFVNRPALESYTLAKMQPIVFSARDGMTLYGYLTLPVGVRPRKLPMIVKVHGGPWVRDVWGLDNEAQWLANRGYAVLQINFRGSIGYGKTYLNAGNREWGGKMENDLIDGKNWAVQQGYANADKICIMGSSYGGYAVLVALATSHDFACGVDLSGPPDLVSFLHNIPAGSSIKPLFTKRVGDVDTEQEFLRSRSPIFVAHQITAPLLIAHGANDVRVRRSESDQMVSAIRRAGREVQYIVFPDEGHGVARQVNRLKFYATVEAFLAKSLGGRTEPPAEDERTDGLQQ